MLVQAISALALLVFRRFYIVRWTPNIGFVANHVLYSSAKSKLLTYPYLHSIYAFLLIYPRNLIADYSYNCVPIIESIEDLRNLATVILYSFITFYMAFTFATRRIRSLLLMLCWIIIPFLPASQIFFPIGTVIAERLLYIPSLGFCFIVSEFLWIFWRRSRAGKIFAVLFISILCAFYSIKTYSRNPVWQNEDTLYMSIYESCPKNVRPPLFLSFGYSKKGPQFTNETIKYAREALEIHPTYKKALRHLGRTLQYSGDHEQALIYLEKCITSPDNLAEPACYWGKGEIYRDKWMKLDQEIRKERQSEQQQQQQQQQQQEQLNIERLRLMEDQMTKYLELSIATLEEGIQQYPGREHVHKMLFEAYEKKKDVANVMKHLARYLKIVPDDPRALAKQGDYFMKSGNKDKALEAYKASIKSPKATPEFKERVMDVLQKNNIA